MRGDLWHAYVDESGDRGWRPRPDDLEPGQRRGSSRIFSLTAILLPDGSQTQYLEQWMRVGIQIGRRPSDVIHWQNVRAPGQRKLLSSVVAGMPGIQVISVVLCKWHLPNAEALRDPGRLYNWTLRLLIERLSWFGERNQVRVASTFSQVKGMPPERLQSYLLRLRDIETQISWPFLKLPPRIDTPANRHMLQIADTASGAVYAAFEWDDYGFTEQSYLQLLRPALWRRSGRPLWKDGLKYGPWPNEGCLAEHGWFDDFCQGGDSE
ncbi:MAG: DUF3800 domain-containing protein [Actinomycetota bacterium]